VTYYIEVMDYGAPGGGALHLTVSPSAGPAGQAWWFPWYDDSGMATTVLAGNTTSNKTVRCTVYIGLSNGALVPRGDYAMNPGEVLMHRNEGLIDGPVKVQCDQPVIASEQAFYSASFNEVAGIPQTQLGTEWWFPWYDNVAMTTWILIGNASDSLVAQCQVYIGVDGNGALVPRGPVLPVQPGGRVTPTYEDLMTGPVKVLCDNPVYVTERAIYKTSFNEVVGIPPSAFNTMQSFPWYDDVYMRTWVLIGNPSATLPATCGVTIGSALPTPVQFVIGPNSRVTPIFDGILDGPVKVECDRPVFASERAIYLDSFNEVVGIPPTQMGTEWWFPWYGGAGINMWVLVGNPSNTTTATCAVTIGGEAKPALIIGPNSRVTPQYHPVADGPVHLSCDQPVYATERATYQTSFSEMVGLQPQ
jgi:hypothetical protein